MGEKGWHLSVTLEALSLTQSVYPTDGGERRGKRRKKGMEWGERKGGKGPTLMLSMPVMSFFYISKIFLIRGQNCAFAGSWAKPPNSTFVFNSLFFLLTNGHADTYCRRMREPSFNHPCFSTMAPHRSPISALQPWSLFSLQPWWLKMLAHLLLVRSTLLRLKTPSSRI